MVDTGEEAPRISIHAREVLRLMRMSGATPGAGVRPGVLRNMWARHLPRAEAEWLDAALLELERAGLTVDRPDGVAPTAAALLIR